MIYHLQTPRATKSKTGLYLLYAGIFLVSIAVFVGYVWIRLGASHLCYGFGDGWLYISIADNLIDNGHFIQTYREMRENMVVPFGLPLLLVPIRLISRNHVLVTVVQYILFGLSNVFIAAAARRYFGARGLFAPAFFTLAVMFRYDASPALVCLTEPWYLFFLTLAIWVLSREDWTVSRRITLLNVFTFASFAIRPATAVFYLPAAGAALYYAIKGKLGKKRCAALLLVPLLIMAANAAVNYRETGVPVLIENYSSVDSYLANNPESVPGKEKYYDSLFGTDEFDYNEVSGKYSQLEREYMAEYPEKFLSDTVNRFYYLFVSLWRGAIIPVAVGIAYILVRDRRKKLFALIFGLMLVMCLASSTTKVNGRYTIFIAPFWALALSSAVSDISHGVGGFAKKLIASKKQ